MTDKELEERIQPIIDIYNQMEIDLIKDIARRFDTYETVGGSLEWHLKKLDEMSILNRDIVHTIAKYSEKSESEIFGMLSDAGLANLDPQIINIAYENGFALLNYEMLSNSPMIKAIIDQSYKEITKTYKLIQTKALESAKQSYMDVLNTAYLEVASGTYDYQSSIRRALKKMAAQGITGATYKRGNKIVQYSLEGTVRRDTLTAVYQLGNKVGLQSCDELGTDYVEISSHLGARVHPTNPIANHAGWQGKVFKIHGFDEEYGNLKSHTGYPDDIQGLGGVNCRHRMWAFFKGLSIPAKSEFSEAENARVYSAKQKQRAIEREIRKWKRMEASAVNDPVMQKAYHKKVREAQAKLRGHIEKHKDILYRDYEREKIYDKKQDIASSEKSDIIRGTNGKQETVALGVTETKEYGNIPKDKQPQFIDDFISQYVNSDTEHMLIIDKADNGYYITSHLPDEIKSDVFADKMAGSYNIHTHPPEQTQFSFSTDADIPAFFADGTAVMEAVDYKYRYRFERPNVTFEEWEKARIEVRANLDLYYDEYGVNFDNYEEMREHMIIDITCKKLGLRVYTRWER